MEHDKAVQIEKTKQCKNCDATLQPEYRFCAHCGQSVKIKRLSLKQVRKDVIKKFLHADEGIIHLTKALALQPGKAIRAYLKGRRKQYYDPLKYLTLSVGISVLATEYFDLMSATSPRSNPVTIFVARHINVIFMLSVPVAAFFSWLFFSKKRYNYAEHLALHAFAGGFRTIFYLLIFTPFVALFREQYNAILLLYFGAWTSYLIWINRQLFEEPLWLVILKTVAIVLFLQIFISLCIFVGAWIIL